ncbi:hypothetical protein KIW84_065167 [Lathyrus oleraceus]|uniref:Replication protein A 70 kDa DNA-binding subunit B/D first OB fold domain-containing protein n=1 Tax=Pisum sativum TaxID=3888 RepID=A0A9D5AA04_PEA|nr:hypothetical protein KIW84_065167 [Pisum sativum]
MAHSIEDIRDINDSKDLWKIVVRIRDLWSITSKSKKEQLEMVIIYAKCDMIQVIIPPYLVQKHKNTLTVGKTYIMQNFKICPIFLCHLNLISLPDILAGKFQLKILVDVIGGVHEIIHTQLNATNNKNKDVFIITDMSEFLFQREIPLLSVSTLQVIIATLDKLEVGQFGWYYDGCSQCTKSVSLKDGKLRCFSNHETDEPVPRYKLNVHVVDEKHMSKFVFCDNECVKLIGKSAFELKTEFYETISASTDYDLAGENSGLTPSKRSSTNSVDDMENVQLSSTKLLKDVCHTVNWTLSDL